MEILEASVLLQRRNRRVAGVGRKEMMLAMISIGSDWRACIGPLVEGGRDEAVASAKACSFSQIDCS